MGEKCSSKRPSAEHNEDAMPLTKLGRGRLRAFAADQVKLEELLTSGLRSVADSSALTRSRKAGAIVPLRFIRIYDGPQATLS